MRGAVTVSDVSDEAFLIANSGQNYYVNLAGDANLADNEYTTAAGDNENSGKSAADADGQPGGAAARLRPGRGRHHLRGQRQLQPGHQHRARCAGQRRDDPGCADGGACDGAQPRQHRHRAHGVPVQRRRRHHPGQPGHHRWPVRHPGRRGGLGPHHACATPTSSATPRTACSLPLATTTCRCWTT